VLREDFPEPQINSALKALKEGRQELAFALLAEAERKAMTQSQRMLKQAAQAAFHQGIISENRVQFREALDHYSRAAKLCSEEASYSNSAGFLAFRLGRFIEAEQYYQHALTLLDRGKSGLMADVLSNLAGVHLDQGHIAEATSILERVRSIQEEDGASPPEIARTLNNLGGIYQAAAKYDLALESYRSALDLREQQFSHESLAVASTLNNMGDLFYGLRDLKSAERYHREALRIRRQLLPELHPDLVPSLNNLATVCVASSKIPEAADLLERALLIQQTVFGSVHHTIAITLNNLAIIEGRRGRSSEAEGYLQKALEIAEATLGADHPWSKLIRQNRADLTADGKHPRRERPRRFVSRLLH
jgi:tetratricopeptide (TPR) repeat protein